VIDKVIAVLVVLAIAVVLRWIGRRWLHRVVYRIMNPSSAIVDQLGALGMGAPKALVTQADDPRRIARAKTMATVFSGAITVLISSVAFLVILGIIGIDLAPLLVGAGVAGVAVGFGAQSLVKDGINGIFILVEDQYGIGDTVEIGTKEGVVERISLRATVLRTPDGGRWHIPNGQVMQVGNLSQLWSVAIVDVVVPADADLTLARRVLQTTAEAVCADPALADSVLDAPQVLGVEHMDSDGVTLRLSVRTSPGRQWRLQRNMREAVHVALASEGVTSSKPKTKPAAPTSPSPPDEVPPRDPPAPA
jgi:small conductance mechanosensitive channel